jgi:hypothetical protein
MRLLRGGFFGLAFHLDRDLFGNEETISTKGRKAHIDEGDRNQRLNPLPSLALPHT